MPTPSQRTPSQRIARLIMDGKIDANGLRTIQEALNARRRIERQLIELENAELPFGSKVKLIGIKPKYLIGMPAIIVPKPEEWHTLYRKPMLYVELKASQGRFHQGSTIAVPPTCVRPIIEFPG